MPEIVAFDAGPLSVITKAEGNPNRDAIRRWYDRLWADGIIFAVPEIAYYEVVREFRRTRNLPATHRLQIFRSETLYLPISTAAMERAAEFWALARTIGYPGASGDSLDADCILAAQTERARGKRDSLVIVTDNLKHFVHFPGIDARPWQHIHP